MPGTRSAPLALLILPLLGPLVARAQPAEKPAGERPFGSASTLQIENDSLGAVLIEAGTKLHREPHHHAAVVTVVDVSVELEPLERLDDWVRVHFAGRVGWAALGELPPLQESRPEAPPPDPDISLASPLNADQERLVQAIDLLGQPPHSFEAGSFRLHTDLGSRRKRETLFKTTSHLADGYRERYGLSPVREASFAVVVFEREASYRRFEDSVGELRRLGAEGHAGSGVAALVAGKRSAAEAAALLVHEAAHLLNRQTFRGRLPPWLEEGIANDLAYCRLDRSGRLLLRTLGGKGFITEIPGPVDRFGRRTFSGTFQIEGPLASLSLLKRKIAAGETVPLAELLDLTWHEFVEPAGRELRYVQSTFLVRYLLDGLDGDAFRGFLRAFQAGGEADSVALLEALDLDWEDLAGGFEAWIEQHTGQP